MTLHNFRLVCLPATLLRDGRICEDCLGKVPWRGVVHRCYRDSLAGSTALATSIALHRAARTFRETTLFAAVSDFVRRKLVQGGLDAARIRVRNNFAWPSPPREGPGETFVFAGRLSPEKGLDLLVESWSSRFPLVVVGDGPERERLTSAARSGVKFVGTVNPAQIPSVLRQARALVVPSQCYEGSPRVIVEALAAGVPVIASDLGGLPEHVLHGSSGLLVPARDRDAWGAAVESLEDDSESMRLGEGAVRSWEADFSPPVSLRGLESLYAEAIRASDS